MIRRGLIAAALVAAALGLWLLAPWAPREAPPPPGGLAAAGPGIVRIATFNTALNRKTAGALADELAGPSPQIDAVIEILLRVRPDIVLINELDRDAQGRALAGFVARLGAGLPGLPGLTMPYAHAGPVNTGVPSKLDLDGDGRIGGPKDAWGFGRFAGQYGMAVLSRYPIETASLRSFQTFPWAALPGATVPLRPDGVPVFAAEIWPQLRLSSKSLWDVPVRLPDGRLLHVLASHPTPPAFDGPEDLNGLRNAAEIALLTGLVDNAAWPVDDQGGIGGVPPGVPLVVLGDLNADPLDGEARREGIAALLASPRLQDPHPTSLGAAEAARLQGGANAAHAGPAAEDTSDWRDKGGPGNLRVDYVLPSRDLTLRGAGVFWPPRADPLSRLVARGASSDHHLVWVDVALGPQMPAQP